MDSQNQYLKLEKNFAGETIQEQVVGKFLVNLIAIRRKFLLEEWI